MCAQHFGLEVSCHDCKLELGKNYYSLMSRLLYSRYPNEEGTEVSVRSLQRLCQKFKRMHTMQDLSRKLRPRLVTDKMLSAMDQILREDDEVTVRMLRTRLCEKFANFPKVSLATIKRLNQKLFYFALHVVYVKVSQEILLGVYTIPLLPAHQGSEQN